MPASDDFPDNLLDAALRADVQPHDTAGLRKAVLSQTVGVIRFRRRMRKGILAASLAGCYLAGVATTASAGRPSTQHRCHLPSFRHCPGPMLHGTEKSARAN